MSYILASLNFVLLCTPSIRLCGLQQWHCDGGIRGWAFLPGAYRWCTSTEDTAGNRKPRAVLCPWKGPLSQVQVLTIQCFQIRLWLSKKKVLGHLFQLLMSDRCCLKEWKAATSGMHRVAEGSEFCSPGPPGTPTPEACVHQLTLPWARADVPDPDVPGRASL